VVGVVLVGVVDGVELGGGVNVVDVLGGGGGMLFDVVGFLLGEEVVCVDDDVLW
jgi:hypothetical protein